MLGWSLLPSRQCVACFFISHASGGVPLPGLRHFFVLPYQASVPHPRLQQRVSFLAQSLLSVEPLVSNHGLWPQPMAGSPVTTDTLTICLHRQDVLEDPQNIVKEELKNKILINEKHAEIAPKAAGRSCDQFASMLVFGLQFQHQLQKC